MKINQINSIYNSNNNRKSSLVSNKNLSKPKALEKDTFKKSSSNNISFTSFMNRGMFVVTVDEEAEFISDIVNGLKTYVEEEEIEKLVKVLSNKEHMQFVARKRTLPVREYLGRLGLETSRRFIKMSEESGIRTNAHLESFLRIFNDKSHNARQTFASQNVEAIKIYGQLSNKNDLGKFAEILLYLYNDEQDKACPDYSKLNITTSFLKNAGLRNFSEFDKYFAHLAYKFNDFENITDKADAIEYLEETFDDKIAKLDTILSNSANSALKSKNANSLYSAMNDIVDCIYDSNNGDLSSLEQILDTIIFTSKIKPKVFDSLKSCFNDFSTTQDKVDLYVFLESLTKIIKELSDNDISKANAQEIYKNYAILINEICIQEEGKIDTIKNLLDAADRFELKNSQSFMSFYNRIAQDNKAILTGSEIEQFLDLLNYTDKNPAELLPQAKTKNISILNLLKERKETYKEVSSAIEEFIINDETNYFAGQSPIQVFNQFYDIISANKDNVFESLQQIMDFEIVNIQEFKQKSQKINQFSNFFIDKKDLLKFFQINKINFEDTPQDKQYQQNCLEILNALYDKTNPQSREKIKYFIKSDFLEKSKNLLSEFLEKTQDIKTRREILSLIIDKKIPSLNALEQFLKDYSSNSDRIESDKKLLNYLQNLPPKADFSAASTTLKIIQEEIDYLNIPIKINSNNISLIDCSQFNPYNISNREIIKLVEILNNNQGNFLSAFETNPIRKPATPFRIALELATKLEQSKESYENISRLLKLYKASLGLAEDCPSCFYVREIEKKLPARLVNFINSSDWINYSNNDKISSNITLHARLRAIERFALNDCNDINELYSKNTKEKLNNLFQTIYTQTPSAIRSSRQDRRIIANFNYNSNIIEAVFSNGGEMITVVPKSR